jgi:hypothetical protein
LAYDLKKIRAREKEGKQLYVLHVLRELLVRAMKAQGRLTPIFLGSNPLSLRLREHFDFCTHVFSLYTIAL